MMLNKLIAATEDVNVLKDIALNLADALNELSPDKYNELVLQLHTKINGYHFSKETLELATSRLKNEDGSTGAHWTVEQTTAVAKNLGIDFANTNYNEYDWSYVMNMLYSDYFGVISNEASAYAKLARKFLEDKDAKDCKAFRYYTTIAAI